MNRSLLLRSAVARAPALRAPWAARATPGLGTLATRLLPWVALGAIVAGALFLRLFRLDGSIIYYPDTYGQLRAVDNLLSGSVPISYHYPPGVALFLAPVFAFFPNTIQTMQATIIAASIALVVLAYVATIVTTGERRAALVFAAAVAISAALVFYSRVALFDVINTLLIALSLFLAPYALRRGPAVLLPYVLLVFTTLTVRHTNLVLLPILFVASLPAGSWSLQTMLRHLRSRAVVTVGLLLLALYIAYVATAIESLSRFTNSQGSSVIDLSGFLPRLGQYVQASLIGYGEEFNWLLSSVAAIVLVLAAVGAQHLWRTNRGMLVPIIMLLVVWSPVHAAYLFFASRYTLPAFYFVLMLATVGLSVSIQRAGRLDDVRQRFRLRSALALAVTMFVGLQIIIHIDYLQQWPERVADNVERSYGEIRPILEDLDGTNSVLLSSQALAVDRANPEMTTYDLITHSETYGINDDSIDRLLAYVEEQQADGKTVYYYYTQFEVEQPRLRNYELGFDAYFVALRQEFSIRLLAYPTERPERLYIIEPLPANE